MEVITNGEQYDILINILNEPVTNGLLAKVKKEHDDYYNRCLTDTQEHLFKNAIKICFYSEFLFFIEEFMEQDGINYFGIDDTFYLLSCENLIALMFEYHRENWHDFFCYDDMSDLITDGIVYLKERQNEGVEPNEV